MVSRGPHVGVLHPWPMSLVSAVFGAEDDAEIEDYLGALVNVRSVSARAHATRYETDWWCAFGVLGRALGAWG
jgi:meiotically up-regulated gene 157 (Mug157) protein